jgi:hypothetical protein
VRQAVLVVLAACGRLGFADDAARDAMQPNRDSASADAASADAANAQAAIDAGVVPDALLPTAYAEFSMDGDPSQGLVAANPAYSGSCTACPTSVPGHTGNAIYFDATTTVTMSFQVGNQPYTIASWFSTNAQGTLLAKPVDQVGVGNVVNIAVDGAGHVMYETYDTGPAYLAGAGASVYGAWHHVAITWDGVTKRIYLDGVGAGSAASTLVDANQQLVLGTDIDYGSPSVRYTGALDDLRFYDTVLTAPQIAALAAL